MKVIFTLMLLGGMLAANAQDQAPAAPKPVKHDNYKQHRLMATLAAGGIDYYRNNYSLPPGFGKNNTTGFPPLYARVEYGFFKHVSLAATLGYDALMYNFYQLYTGQNNDIIRRYKTDDLRIFGGMAAAYYHLGDCIHVKRLDPFVGVGIGVSNLRYSAYPQGDTLSVRKEHTATPMLKAGVRYYLTRVTSLYADAGYDKQSIFSAGLSCRFEKRKPAAPAYKPQQ